MKFLWFYVFSTKGLAAEKEASYHDGYRMGQLNPDPKTPAPEPTPDEIDAAYKRGLIEGANEESTVFEDAYDNGKEDGISEGYDRGYSDGSGLPVGVRK